VVLSPQQVARLLNAAPGLKYNAAQVVIGGPTGTYLKPLQKKRRALTDPNPVDILLRFWDRRELLC
jgi:hypothetical protein